MGINFPANCLPGDVYPSVSIQNIPINNPHEHIMVHRMAQAKTALDYNRELV